MIDVAANYSSVQAHVKSLSPQATLVCVSKTKPIEDLRKVFDAGGRVFGENYVEEIIEKGPQLPEAQFHFIGHLQSNKVSKLCKVPNLAMIQTIDSISLAEKVNRALPAVREPLPVLVQVNTSGEEQKSGIKPGEDVSRTVKYIIESCPKLRFRGLMTIGECGEASRDFEALAKERERVASELGVQPNTLDLSMGMSADYELALQMGATLVRVGSTIFGARNYAK